MRNSSTIRDVAKLAGVSVATVSYVINKTEGKTISEQTTARVLDAVRQLGYITNNAAKTLQSNKTGCVGLVVHQSFILTRYAHILQGILDVLWKSGYNTLICSENIEPNGNPDYLNSYLSHRVDGIIFISADGHSIDSSVESMIVEQSIPFVACDLEPNRFISSVDIDHFAGAYDMTRFLIDKGVKRILYTRPDDDNRQEKQRDQGVRRAVYESPDVELIPLYFKRAPSSLTIPDVLEGNIEHMTEGCALLNSWSGSDRFVLSFCRKHGFDFPVATLAHGNLDPELFDNLYYSYIPTYLLGQRTAKAILKLIKDPSDIVHELLKPTLAPSYVMGDLYQPYVDDLSRPYEALATQTPE